MRHNRVTVLVLKHLPTTPMLILIPINIQYIKYTVVVCTFWIIFLKAFIAGSFKCFSTRPPGLIP